jgi:hypothetical protein
MATLKDVSELIKKNDTTIIGELEDQSSSLDSIDRGIQKFLKINERKRLDDLEDRRERRSRIGAVGGIGAATAASAGAGGTGGGGGGLLGTILKVVGGIVGASAFFIGKKIIDSFTGEGRRLGTDTKDLKNRIKDLENKVKADAKNFDNQRKTFDAETKKLQGRIATLETQNQITENKKLSLEAEQAKMNSILQQKELQAMRKELGKSERSRFARRQRITDVNRALAEQEALRAAGQDELQRFQQRARQMSITQTPLEGYQAGKKVIYVTGAGKPTIAEVKGPALDGSGRVILEMETPSGGKVQFLAVTERIQGPATADDIANSKQARRLGTDPVLRPQVTSSILDSKALRGLNVLDPIGFAEEVSRGVSAAARGGTSAASRLVAGSAARSAAVLGGPIGIAAAIVVETTSATGGKILQTPSGVALAEDMDVKYAMPIVENIAQFLQLVYRGGGRELKKIMDLRVAITESSRSNPRGFDEALLYVFGKPNTDGVLEIDDTGKDGIAQFLALLNMSNADFGMFLKEYYGNLRENFPNVSEINASFARRMKAMSANGTQVVPTAMREAAIQSRDRQLAEALKGTGLTVDVAKTMIPTATAIEQIGTYDFGGANGGVQVNNVDNSVINQQTQNMGLATNTSTPAVDTMMGGISLSRYRAGAFGF